MSADWPTQRIRISADASASPGSQVLEAISRHLYVRADTAEDLAAARAIAPPILEGEADLGMAVEWFRMAGLDVEVRFPVLHLRAPR
jgi:hypothetical protein